MVIEPTGANMGLHHPMSQQDWDLASKAWEIELSQDESGVVNAKVHTFTASCWCQNLKTL